MLDWPSPFVMFILLIVNSGMDAVSFAAKHAMRPSCLSCAEIILFLLLRLLEDGSGSMTVLIVFDTWTLLGESFLSKGWMLFLLLLSMQCGHLVCLAPIFFCFFLFD